MRRAVLRIIHAFMFWDEDVRTSKDWFVALVFLLGVAFILMFAVGDRGPNAR